MGHKDFSILNNEPVSFKDRDAKWREESGDEDPGQNLGKEGDLVADAPPDDKREDSFYQRCRRAPENPGADI